MSDVTLSEVLEECGVSPEQYDNTLGCVEKKVSILYKWKPSEVKIGLYKCCYFKTFKV